MRISAGVVVMILAGCGTSSPSTAGGADAPESGADAPESGADAQEAGADAVQPLAWPTLTTPGRSPARLAVTATDVIVLEETLVGFDQQEPGPRRVRAIDRKSFAERTWAPPASARLADAVVHPSGAVTVAVVDEHGGISLVRLHADLTPAFTTPLEDDQVATDPVGAPTATLGLSANGATADSVRVAALGEDAAIAVLTWRNSLIAYRLRAGDGAFTTIWRSLIEPAVGLTPFLPIGGSFDTFGAIVAWFRPSLATDGQGNAYLAVWAGQRRILAHTLVFDDGLAPLPTDPDVHDSDVLVTKIDGDGNRLWSRVVGTKYEDEPYALAAAADEVVVVGRSRRNPRFDNSQWDPWLAAVDASGALVASRTFVFDASGIFLAVALDGHGAITAGGSDGWTQNPDGLSILSFGAKLAVTIAGASAEPERLGLAAGPRHNEVRAIIAADDGTWVAAHEDGPLTHSGDGDASQIHATGVVTLLPRP
jgi:hypothetical protein